MLEVQKHDYIDFSDLQRSVSKSLRFRRLTCISRKRAELRPYVNIKHEQKIMHGDCFSTMAFDFG